MEWKTLNDDEDALVTTLPAGRKKTIVKLIKVNTQLTGSQDHNAIVPRSIEMHLQLEPQVSSDLNATTDVQ